MSCSDIQDQEAQAASDDDSAGHGLVHHLQVSSYLRRNPGLEGILHSEGHQRQPLGWLGQLRASAEQL